MAGQLEAVTAAFRDRYAGKRNPDWDALWRTCWRDAVREDARQARARAAEARNAAPAVRRAGGAIPGHISPTASATAVTRGGGAIYDRVSDAWEAARWYLPSSPEAQAYIARAERDGEPEPDIARYRERGVKLRPSEAARVMAGSAVGSQPVGGIVASILARAAGQPKTVAEVVP